MIALYIILSIVFGIPIYFLIGKYAVRVGDGLMEAVIYWNINIFVDIMKCKTLFVTNTAHYDDMDRVLIFVCISYWPLVFSVTLLVTVIVLLFRMIARLRTVVFPLLNRIIIIKGVVKVAKCVGKTVDWCTR